MAAAVGEATRAVCRGDRRTCDMYLELLATEQAPGWTQAVSREIAGFLRSSVTAAWRQAREGTAATAAVATAIELLNLLQHLPMLEQPCRCPGWHTPVRHSASGPSSET